MLPSANAVTLLILFVLCGLTSEFELLVNSHFDVPTSHSQAFPRLYFKFQVLFVEAVIRFTCLLS